MLSRREQLKLWLERKKKGSSAEKKKTKNNEENKKRIVRRRSVLTRRISLSDRTNQEQNKQNRRQSIVSISKTMRRSSSVRLLKKIQTIGTQTSEPKSKAIKKKNKKLKRKVKSLKEKLRILHERFQMLGCERDVLILECMDKEKQWSEREGEYRETIETMKSKEEQFQKDTNAQIVQLKHQLITGLQASVAKVNDLKAELQKERDLVEVLRKEKNVMCESTS